LEFHARAMLVRGRRRSDRRIDSEVLKTAETAQHWFCQGSSNECRGK
jgi:hypothetical protein